MTGRGGHITIGGKTVAVTEWGMTRSRPTPTDLDLLLAAVLAEPDGSADDDTRRLVYADALDEAGECDRAEFVRLSILYDGRAPRSHRPGCPRRGLYRTDAFHEREMPRAPACGRCRHESAGERVRDVVFADGVADDVRRRALGVVLSWRGLFGRVHPTLGPEEWAIYPPGTMPERALSFDRGFVEGAICTAADWIANADAILAAHPVRRVTWTEFRHEDRVAIGRRFATSGVRITAGRLYADSGAELWPRVEFTLPPPPVEVGPDGGFLLPDAEFLPALLAATGSVAGDPIAIPPPPS